jgi:hypothetical protein
MLGVAGDRVVMLEMIDVRVLVSGAAKAEDAKMASRVLSMDDFIFNSSVG